MIDKILGLDTNFGSLIIYRTLQCDFNIGMNGRKLLKRKIIKEDKIGLLSKSTSSASHSCTSRQAFGYWLLQQ